MARKFALTKRQNNSGGILDIPHIGFLRYATPKELVEKFIKRWGASPEAVVLPVTSPDGLLFGVDGLSDPLSGYATDFADQLKDFSQIVRAFGDLGLGIYLSIDPSLPFITTDALHIQDIIGTGSQQVCIANPRSQDVISAILGTGIDKALEALSGTSGKLVGSVMDAADLWPMGGAKDRIKLTCFCRSCERIFEREEPGILSQFKTWPNPWNLLLQIEKTGIDYIDTITSSHSASDICGFSRQRGFSDVFGADQNTNSLNVKARHLIRYMEIRHDLTVSSLAEIFRQAHDGLSARPDCIILTEGSDYSWTGGLQLDRLDVPLQNGKEHPYDEVWFSPSDGEMFLKHVPFRSYMWRRSRYFIDAFLQTAFMASNQNARATTGIARISDAGVRTLLSDRLNQALGAGTNGATALVALPDLQNAGGDSQRLGFVGVALDEDIGRRFVNGVSIAPGLSQAKHGPDDTGNPMLPMLEMLAHLAGSERE